MALSIQNCDLRLRGADVLACSGAVEIAGDEWRAHRGIGGPRHLPTAPATISVRNADCVLALVRDTVVRCGVGARVVIEPCVACELVFTAEVDAVVFVVEGFRNVVCEALGCARVTVYAENVRASASGTARVELVGTRRTQVRAEAAARVVFKPC